MRGVSTALAWVSLAWLLAGGGLWTVTGESDWAVAGTFVAVVALGLSVALRDRYADH